jgi:hypothetical protein
MEVRVIARIASLLMSFFLFASKSQAQCLGLVNGPIVFDVASCKAVVPTEDFIKDFDFSFIKGLSAQDRAKFFASYKGFLITGLVVKSEAIKKGFDTKKGALLGEKISAFVPQGTSTCETLDKKRLKVNAEEYCCSGSGNSPCLLGTTYLFPKPEPLGAAGTSAGDSERKKSENSPEFKAAEDLYKKKDFKNAAKKLEQLRATEALDLRGHYLLGVTYRKLEQCKRAIPVLQTVFDRAAKKDIWADQESIVRKSTFLLARCLAKTNDPGRAVIILSSYLVDPKKYRSEIQRSLKHPDFGYINASKEYSGYRTDARAKLGETSSAE